MSFISEMIDQTRRCMVNNTIIRNVKGEDFLTFFIITNKVPERRLKKFPWSSQIF
jgi:hypothetical protein